MYNQLLMTVAEGEMLLLVDEVVVVLVLEVVLVLTEVDNVEMVLTVEVDDDEVVVLL